MFYERSQSLSPESAKLFGLVARSGERVLGLLPNDVNATSAARNHETWHLCAVTSTLRIVVEAMAGDDTASTATNAATGCYQDAICFPCRNVAATLRAHNIAAGVSNGAVVDLSHHLSWVSGAASVTSVLANIHQKDALRMSNAAHLPTIAGIVETQGDKRRFLAVLTPYDPTFAASEKELQLSAAAQRAAEQKGERCRKKFFERHPLSTTQRAFDAPPQDEAQGGAYDMDDSEASSLLDAKHRPEGIAYSLSLCQVSAASSMVAVGLDGAYIAVFQPSDLVDGGGGLALPLVVRPASPLEVVSLGYGTGTSAIRMASARSAHHQLCWAAAVAPNERITIEHSLCIATLLSDGTVRTFAIARSDAVRHNNNNDGHNNNGNALYSPAEAVESPSASSPWRHEVAASEMVLHLTGTTSLRGANVEQATPGSNPTTEPVCKEGRGGGDGIELDGKTIARLSPNAGLVCFASNKTSEVVVVPLGHDQQAVRISLPSQAESCSHSESTDVYDLLWLGDVAKGLIVVTAPSPSAPRSVWWVGVTAAVQCVERRDFFIEPSENALEEVPSLTRQSPTLLDQVKGLLPGGARPTLLSIVPGRSLTVLPQRRNSPLQSLRVLFVDGPAAQCSGAMGLYVVHVSLPPNLSSQLRSILPVHHNRGACRLQGVIAALFYGRCSLAGALGTLLALLPKHDVSRFIACANTVCESYVRCLRGVVPCDANEGAFPLATLKVMETMQSICSTELQLLRNHVLTMLGAHGCISAMLDCASVLVDSPLRGTVDVSQIADLALATICADANLAAMLVPSHVKAPIRHRKVGVLIAAASPETKSVISWKSTHDAHVALVQQTDTAATEAARQAKTALRPRPMDLRQLQTALAEFIDAAKVVATSLSPGPVPDPSIGAQQLNHNRLFVQRFAPVVSALGQEIDALVPFLLVSHGSAGCVEWLQSIQNACGTLSQVQQGAVSPATTEVAARAKAAQSLLLGAAAALR